MLRQAVFATIAAVLSATPAVPCAFHGYTPQLTFVERMLGSDHIVLARPSEADPFKFGAITPLVGSAAGVDIDQLVDSTTRRRLALNPSDHVLFARDMMDGTWRRLVYVDAAMEPVLDTVMARLADWQVGDDVERFAYFAGLLNHPDTEIHNLALRELDLADYGLLRALPLEFDTKRVLARLNLPSEVGLRPIRVLLLGFSDAPGIVDALEHGVARYAAISGAQFGAFSTALIEHSGGDAARWLIEEYLTDATLPADSREVLAQALALHSSSGDPATQVVIQTAVSEVLRSDPTVAPMVARQFGARSDWSQREALAEVIKSGGVASHLDSLLLSQYIAIASEIALPTAN